MVLSKPHWRILLFVFLALSIVYLVLNEISQRLPNKALCTGFAACRLFQNPNRYVAEAEPDVSPDLDPIQINAFWNSNPKIPHLWSPEELREREIPSYVLKYAPYIHLSSRERFWPGDIAQHLAHSTLYADRTAIDGAPSGLNGDALLEFTDFDNGENIFLHSEYDSVNPPKWLSGIDNLPRARHYPADYNFDSNPPTQSYMGLQSEVPEQTAGSLDDEECRSVFGWLGNGEQHCADFCDANSGGCQNKIRYINQPKVDLKKRTITNDEVSDDSTATQAGRSDAPAILIVTPKENGVVDAFWFFFYSFNWGPEVLGRHFGNHGGDWEHTAIRFKNGKPTYVFLSSHHFGNAWSFQALEKYNINSTHVLSSWANSTIEADFQRPVVYSAVGSHAMYATAGEQPYILPWDVLRDQTDRGPLWDPSLNVKSYLYDTTTEVLRPSTLNPRAPTEWFHYAGRWGSKELPDSDSRQYSFVGEQHFKVGPRGPKFKNLGRTEICGSKKGRCRFRRSLNDPPE